MMERVLKISKLEAAKRQLETAINLYFSDGDPISIHTLTSAGYNIIRDVSKKQGRSLIVKDLAVEHAKPEFRDMVKRELNRAENFFKHGERDYAHTLDFRPIQSEVLIFDACLAYQALTDELLPSFLLFRGWFIVNNGNCFHLTPEEEELVGNAPAHLAAMGRQKYFECMSAIVTHVSAVTGTAKK